MKLSGKVIAVERCAHVSKWLSIRISFEQYGEMTLHAPLFTRSAQPFVGDPVEIDLWLTTEIPTAAASAPAGASPQREQSQVSP